MVAAALSDSIARAIARHGKCALALSGGSTPRALYRVLATEYRTRIPWAQVDVFWGDERFVAASDAQSNYGMAKAELLDHVPCPAGNVHPIPTDVASAAIAADSYAVTLRSYFGDRRPHFDLILLGIGEDCHTASLFPHSADLKTRLSDSTPVVASDRLVAATRSAQGGWRVTLTMPVLTAADTVFVMAAGARKAPAIARALAADTNPEDCPAAALRHATGRVIWWLDQAAKPPSEFLL